MALNVSVMVLQSQLGCRPRASASKRKIVLWLYADVANPDGGGCWPGIGYIAAVAECSERQAIRVVQSLVEDGLLVKVRESAPGAPGRAGRPTEYRIDLDMLAEHSLVLNPVDIPGEQGDTVSPLGETG